MRTLTDATLYTVSSLRGTYFALLDHDSGCILTEPTETAAAALANQRDLVIVDQVQITEDKLRKLMVSRYGEVHSSAPADVKSPAMAVPELADDPLHIDTLAAHAGA